LTYRTAGCAVVSVGGARCAFGAFVRRHIVSKSTRFACRAKGQARRVRSGSSQAIKACGLTKKVLVGASLAGQTAKGTFQRVIKSRFTVITTCLARYCV